MSGCSNYTMEHAALMVRARKMALRYFSNYPQEIDWEVTKKYSRLVAGLAGLLARRFTNSTQRHFFFLPRIFRARHRQPVRRSAAKSGGDDGGGDGDSDGPGEPPRPSYTGRIIPSAPVQARLIPCTCKTNNFPPSRIPPPCSWCMAGRWAA